MFSESTDKSTEQVMDWLHYFETIFVRKNVDQDYTNFNLIITSEKTEYTFKDFVIWNRRGYLQFIPSILKNTNWITYLKKEQVVATIAIESSNSNNFIGSYQSELSNNKLLNLEHAIQVGLQIPATIVTNNREDLMNFICEGKKYITKALEVNPTLETQDSFFIGNGTTILDLEFISKCFAPSFVQEYIEKEVEIRVFFIEDDFYSMAIFSQNDKQTQIDFRNYNTSKPNRNVPFLLPKQIERKLIKFKNLIGCNTGSIDLILTPAGEFVFLEINPMGQYHWLSENCNYYIDKQIAHKLINKN